MVDRRGNCPFVSPVPLAELSHQPPNIGLGSRPVPEPIMHPDKFDQQSDQGAHSVGLFRVPGGEFDDLLEDRLGIPVPPLSSERLGDVCESRYCAGVAFPDSCLLESQGLSGEGLCGALITAASVRRGQVVDATDASRMARRPGGQGLLAERKGVRKTASPEQ
jgi:hypothetical protein